MVALVAVRFPAESTLKLFPYFNWSGFIDIVPFLAVREFPEIDQPPIYPSLASTFPVNVPDLAVRLPFLSTVNFPPPRAIPSVPRYTPAESELKAFIPEYSLPASITKPFVPPI